MAGRRLACGLALVAAVATISAPTDWDGPADRPCRGMRRARRRRRLCHLLPWGHHRPGGGDDERPDRGRAGRHARERREPHRVPVARDHRGPGLHRRQERRRRDASTAASATGATADVAGNFTISGGLNQGASGIDFDQEFSELALLSDTWAGAGADAGCAGGPPALGRARVPRLLDRPERLQHHVRRSERRWFRASRSSSTRGRRRARRRRPACWSTSSPRRRSRATCRTEPLGGRQPAAADLEPPAGDRAHVQPAGRLEGADPRPERERQHRGRRPAHGTADRQGRARPDRGCSRARLSPSARRRRSRRPSPTGRWTWSRCASTRSATSPCASPTPGHATATSSGATSARTRRTSVPSSRRMGATSTSTSAAATGTAGSRWSPIRTRRIPSPSMRCRAPISAAAGRSRSPSGRSALRRPAPGPSSSRASTATAWAPRPGAPSSPPASRSCSTRSAATSRARRRSATSSAGSHTRSPSRIRSAASRRSVPPIRSRSSGSATSASRTSS